MDQLLGEKLLSMRTWTLPSELIRTNTNKSNVPVACEHVHVVRFWSSWTNVLSLHVSNYKVLPIYHIYRNKPVHPAIYT